MQSDSIEPFLSNWGYLKAELNWLDRLLSVAVARQRQDAKEVDRLSRSPADRVTSHWWKGLVSLEGEISYDSPVAMPARKPASTKTTYQQQLDVRIQASQQRGIVLGLPSLRDRLHLTLFEKNLILVALAPEISRRYGRIYNYLQGVDPAERTDLPTVDLVLRILCRNDQEWRSARHHLSPLSKLLQHQLVAIHASHPQPLLARRVMLSDSLVSYLLSDRPSPLVLESLLTAPTPHSLISSVLPPPTPWSALILPPALITDLQHLCNRVQVAHQVDDLWGFQSATAGTVALLVGATGTGKTMAAQAIAQALQTHLVGVDLATLQPTDHTQVVQEMTELAPIVLLIKSAHYWFGRSPCLNEAFITRFLYDRQQFGVTLISVEGMHQVRPHWQRQMNPILKFPLPDQASRLRLWQQAFPVQVPVEATIDWQWLARKFPLTGGEIRAIAREAALLAVAESPQKQVSLHHVVQAHTRLKGKLKSS